MLLRIRGIQGFEWDEANWRKSERKHGVSAVEAEEVLLAEPMCRVDTRHSGAEQRFVALGTSQAGRRLFVAFTVRRNRIRIVSARPMSRRERGVFEEEKAVHRG